MPILIELKKYSEKKELKISIISSLIFLALAIILYGLMLKMREIKNIDLPIIYIIKNMGNIYGFLYGIIICFAIYTSAISAGFSFIKNFSKKEKTYKYLSIFLCISSIFISRIGFSKLVNLLYPVFGIIGLIQIVYMIFKEKNKLILKECINKPKSQ